MNIVCSRKLLRTKWTATTPFHDETHFLVQHVCLDHQGLARGVVIQGLNNRHQFELTMAQLEDSDRWQLGWK
ncbi:TIGR02450 family Trp-rich protein [uncultured Ferrimonas sp.]|uniref:TIGR02450 family Trp-rich protein n=1 Tax=uncultured Ferrimonas sp. TaxID=432640 RepID=UPI00260C3399|nr:TIGR02450 family Trp-rich protein [uncultured Ferrimonas sp.]